MRKIVPFVLMIVCCAEAGGQKSTLADPFGLTAFGFREKQERRTLVKPAEGPSEARECGAGIYVREETVPVNDRPKKIKVLILYFVPNPDTAAAFGESPAGSKFDPALAPLPSPLPLGVSSLTFFWPAKSWPPQQVLLMRAERVGSGLIGRSMSLPAVFAVQEGDSPSILWTYDTSRSRGLEGPEIVGNLIASDPVMFKLSLPRGAKKCVEGK